MKNVIAVDIGGSKLVIGAVDETGKVVYKQKFMLVNVSKDKLIAVIADAYRQLPPLDYSAVGINIPGLADPENGVWVHAPYSGVSQFEIVKELTPLFNLPIHIENDVNACAVAEKRFGICKDTDDFLWVTVSNGIGGALFLNGRLYTGCGFNAGEIGHFIVEEQNGFECGCGNRGCLEAMAAGPAIARLYCNIAKISYDKNMRSKQVGELARSGDENAKAAFDKAGYYLGKALSYAANLVNPKKIVLGGGVLMDEELILPPTKTTFEKMLFNRANPEIQLVKTSLGYDAALIGAASLAL